MWIFENQKLMRYSIITPSILRTSLIKLCESIDIQIEKDYEHLIAVDLPINIETIDTSKYNILKQIASNQQRKIYLCKEQHGNYGQICRYNLWEQVKGEYILYIDDDNYYVDESSLKSLNYITSEWAIFPILCNNKLYLPLPPELGKTDTCMFMHKKGVARWPIECNSYEADGFLVEELKIKYPNYQILDTKPIAVYTGQNLGRYF